MSNYRELLLNAVPKLLHINGVLSLTRKIRALVNEIRFPSDNEQNDKTRSFERYPKIEEDHF